MPTTRLVAVGAVACDILLDVPFYPPEDFKLRATACHKRRGGNVGNTLEVLTQLLARGVVGEESEAEVSEPNVELFLVAALPSRTASSIDFISSSFHPSSVAEADGCSADRERLAFNGPAVNMQYCLYREDYDEPVMSYIISSEANMSRTIVNHNPLPEMTLEEFRTIADELLMPSPSSMTALDGRLWFHFEGRIPETTLQSMRYLRQHPALGSNAREITTPLRPTISVELEKPAREGLQDLAAEADVVFYSRSWAEGEGYQSAEECIQRQANLLGAVSDAGTFGPEQRLLICTWGSNGACALLLDQRASRNAGGVPAVVHSPAFVSDTAPVVDTTGAGDTFIAGVLFQLLRPESVDGILRSLPLKQILDSANAIAGRKILQQGFAGLAQAASCPSKSGL